VLLVRAGFWAWAVVVARETNIDAAKTIKAVARKILNTDLSPYDFDLAQICCPLSAAEDAG